MIHSGQRMSHRGKLLGLLMGLLGLLSCYSPLEYVHATDSSAAEEGDEADIHPDQHKNVQDLRSLSQTNDGLVPLNDQVFSRLVLEKNRPYGIYVLFNARDKRFNCDVCGPFEDELRLVAQSYKKMKEKDDIPLLFFGVAEWGPNQRSFNQYNIKSVPKLVYFGPTREAPHKPNQFPQEPMMVTELHAEAITEYVRGTSGLSVEIHRSQLPKLIVLLVILVTLALALRYASEKLLSLAQTIRAFKPLWVMASLTIVFIAVSGVLFDIIRGVPWVGMNPQTRKVEWYTTQSGIQYGMEGFVIGCLNMGCALTMVLLAQYLPRAKRDNQMTMAIVMVIAFGFCYTRICSLYRAKNPWYFSSLGFF